MGDKRLGHTIKITPLEEGVIGATRHGTPELTFRAMVQPKGRKDYERTVVARGRAHDALAGILRVGEQVAVRGFYDRPAANDGRKGPEIITAIGLPFAA